MHQFQVLTSMLESHRCDALFDMSDIFDTAAQVARNAVPAVLCGAGGLSRLGQDIAGKVNPFYEGSLLDGYQTGVTNALRGFCPTPPAGEIPGPGFQAQGGQCAGVRYRVSASVRISNTAPPTAANYVTSTQNNIFGQFYGPIAPRIQGAIAQFTYRTSTGVLQTYGLGSSATSGPDNFYPPQFLSFSVERVDGQPDNCGDPPPVPPPGVPNPNPPNPPGTDVTIDLPDIGPVVVSFTPVVGIAYIDADAEFNVPVTVNVDVGGQDINFDLDFDINISDPTQPPKPKPPDRPKNPDDRVDPPDCPPPADCRNEPDEDPPEEEPEDEDPKEFIVTGAVALCVVDASTTRATEIAQVNGPNIWAPRLGYIRFKYETNRGDEVWGTDIAVKGTNFATEAPDLGVKCIGAVLNTERGVTGELILLRKKRTAGCC